MARSATRSSKRQKGINALTAGPRPDAVALARIASNDLEPVYDTAGTVTETQRRSNVFRILRTAETITPNQSAAGARAVELFATWKGLAGAPETADPGFIDKGAAQPELVTDRMLKAGRTWKQVMIFVGPSSARLLEALCRDIVEGDGSFVMAGKGGGPKVRWRHIVEKVTKERDRNRQSTHVAKACADLAEFWR